MAEINPELETIASIKVIGCGGGGGSTLNQMVAAGIHGVEFIALNTDIQALQNSLADKKIHIGKTITRGLGAGMDPEMGRKSAEENQNEIREALKDADMVFIAVGFGGGTGSGAAPVVANIAKELGALTIAVVTKPFSFEGTQRKMIADKAHENILGKVDSIITIPNDRILQIIDKKTSLLDAFAVVDDVLRQGVQGISELVTVHGLTNVDFADVKFIMQESGTAVMGIGVGKGESRAIDAAKAAIECPLLEASIAGANRVLFNLTGGRDLGMFELTEAAKVITEQISPDARIIYGTVIDENLTDEVKITVVATDFIAAKSSSNKATTGTTSRAGMDLSKYGLSGREGNNRAATAPTYSSSTPAPTPPRPINNAYPQQTVGSNYVEAPSPSGENRIASFGKDSDAQEASSQPQDFQAESNDSGNSSEEGDLDIPAFIRRKMN